MPSKSLATQKEPWPHRNSRPRLPIGAVIPATFALTRSRCVHPHWNALVQHNRDAKSPTRTNALGVARPEGLFLVNSFLRHWNFQDSRFIHSYSAVQTPTRVANALYNVHEHRTKHLYNRTFIHFHNTQLYPTLDKFRLQLSFQRKYLFSEIGKLLSSLGFEPTISWQHSCETVRQRICGLFNLLKLETMVLFTSDSIPWFLRWASQFPLRAPAAFLWLDDNRK